jgi:hypothetical protein
MFVNSNEGQEIVQDLSKRLVSELAPEELEMFDELYSEYRANPVPVTVADSDDPLGFGINEIAAAVTPAAGAAVSAAIAYVSTEVIKFAKDESSVLIQRKIKSLFNSEKKIPQETPPPLTLTQKDLEQIKDLAFKSARAQGLSPKKAEQMALALVGQLALS